MATLTADPIVSEQVVLEMLTLTGDQARQFINAVSASFKNFTHRSRITRGSTVERYVAPPPHKSALWLRATPVASVSSVAIYSGGKLQRTLDSDDYVLNTDTGRMTLFVRGDFQSTEQVIYVAYTGGWETVPGDVQQTALEMIRLQHARLQGRVGITSESREGHSVSYEPGAVPSSVADVWRAYRIYS